VYCKGEVERKNGERAGRAGASNANAPLTKKTYKGGPDGCRKVSTRHEYAQATLRTIQIFPLHSIPGSARPTGRTRRCKLQNCENTATGEVGESLRIMLMWNFRIKGKRPELDRLLADAHRRSLTLSWFGDSTASRGLFLTYLEPWKPPVTWHRVCLPLRASGHLHSYGQDDFYSTGSRR